MIALSTISAYLAGMVGCGWYVAARDGHPSPTLGIIWAALIVAWALFYAAGQR